MKKLIKVVEAARGNGTRCMISLVVQPGDKIACVAKMLGFESNIKSTQSVFAALYWYYTD
ncbi:hypothetical protein ACS0TY_026031 [Phlomoides rotata]